jgi:hypothetical protein
VTALSLAMVLLAVSPTMACRSADSSASPPARRTPLSNAATSITAANKGSSSVTNSDEEKARILAAHRAMYRAMLGGRTAELGALLDDGYSLTHITGYRQPKREWLGAIDSGEMRYHSEQENSVTIEVSDATALLVARSVVTATIFGARGTWNLQLTTTYARKADKWMAMRTVATTF